METRLTDPLKTVLFLIPLLCAVSSENDLYLKFCGTWRHGKNALNLNVNLSTGCGGISISANESSLSINGKITAQCARSDVIPLNKFGLNSEVDSDFCLYWEPLLDQLKLKVGGRNLTLCWPASPKDSCCTDLSYGANAPEAKYGIINGAVQDDIITDKILTAYNFSGRSTSTDKLCKQANQTFFNNTGETATRPPCAKRFESGLKEATGSDITSSATSGLSEPAVAVLLPRVLNNLTKSSSKVVITFFNKNSLFQEGYNEVKLLNDVVDISVENEIIADLSEPIRIGFNHDVIPKKHSRKCVSWDTRKDPLLVNWLVDGCETIVRGAEHTECMCNHLTYFTVLVEMKPRPVRHLLALSAITSVGCAISFISCIALIVLLCRKRKRSKEQSIPSRLGLAVSLALLSLLFFFTGVLANVGGGRVCTWVGGFLHYVLLSSFTWMGIEVFYNFWLLYKVHPRPSPKSYVWILVGFVLPVVPVVILTAVGDIYGLREVVPSDDISSPYLMCWMKGTSKALLAHYFTTMTVLTILVLSGIVMLFLVFRKSRTWDEWKNNQVAFLSIWGLSCLFGTTWGLALINFEPLSDFIHFLFCILNSFQGFFLMLRFCMLDWMRKQASGSVLGSTSSGSTRQHMLQCQEKS
ncbi:adhesion G protein-coupled receptor G3-like [Odontesthes bonariensis]|uniref:adhesion G-protein coupled receptor G1-like n=1 Tax=Odontesthes bonariensis TaxID=219752 RepID=UPI003F5864B6